MSLPDGGDSGHDHFLRWGARVAVALWHGTGFIVLYGHFRLYVFFRYAFATPVHSPLFDPVFPYLAIPVHLAHTLHQHPPPQPVQQVPSESNPLEEMDTSSSSSGASDDSYAPADSGMVNKFLSSGFA